jgi:Holliday junction resolvase RusA-like endonuclease
MVSFVVPGNPVPQPRPRVSMRGGFARAYVPADHPVHAFRQAVQLAAAGAGLRQVSTPVRVVIGCVFERPQSHHTSRGLKPGVPMLPRPDVDNLAKAVLDALGGFFDDTLVEGLTVAKAYGVTARTEVTIKCIS